MEQLCLLMLSSLRCLTICILCVECDCKRQVATQMVLEEAASWLRCRWGAPNWEVQVRNGVLLRQLVSYLILSHHSVIRLSNLTCGWRLGGYVMIFKASVQCYLMLFAIFKCSLFDPRAGIDWVCWNCARLCKECRSHSTSTPIDIKRLTEVD